MKIYDMHCHIDLMPSMSSFADEALRNDIGILAVTTTPKAYAKEISILNKYTNIRVALGLHPQLAGARYNELRLIETYIDEAVYIGEIGLDFNKEFYASKKKQVDIFENIIKWSNRDTGKVISIHAVHSDKMVLDILEKYHCTEKNKCILHWFSGSLSQLRRAIAMECFFSINGVMLTSASGQMLIKNIPPEKIVFESDAPFIKDIKSVQQLKTEFETIESSLISILGGDIADLVHNTSKTLLSFF